MGALRWIAAADSQQGLRHNNEDFFLLDPVNGLFLLADGMGGHQAGEVASAMAAKEIQRAWTHLSDLPVPANPEKDRGEIARTLFETNTAIREAAAIDGQAKMGTTVVLLGRMGQRWFVANLGDSEIWLIRRGKVQPLLRVHTMASELVRQKAMSPKDAAHSPLRHRLYRYLGTSDLNTVADLNEDVKPFQPVAGDCILLGSDGLVDHIRKEQVVEILDRGTDLETTARQLTQLAIQQGSPDNTTGVLIRFFQGP